MQQYVWGWLGKPRSFDAGKAESADVAEQQAGNAAAGGELDADNELPYWWEREAVKRAAVIVAMRAAAGDHPATYKSFGQALYHADLTDLRLMRLLTTPPGMRLEMLRRMLQRLDHDNIGFDWSLWETSRLYDFLFGDEEEAQWSVNRWAEDFLAARGKIMADEPADSTETATTP
jgi:hypothetical protein